MDIKALTIFMEVAELGSFTKVGEKLGYSQPTISFQIKQLEKELGVSLFDRIGHTVTLTDAGRDALRYAQHICHLSQEMLLDTAGHREPAGVLRLGMPDSLCEPLIAGHFHAFRNHYPKISLQIFTGDTEHLLGYLDHNEADLILTMDDHLYNPNYVIVDEEAIDVHFVVSPENMLTQKDFVTIEELLQHPFLLTEKGMSYRRLMDEQLAARSLEVRPVLETARADLICELAAQNRGVSFLPDYVTELAVRAGRLKRLEIPGFTVTVWKQLLYRRDKWLSPQMKAMLTYLADIRLQGDIL